MQVSTSEKQTAKSPLKTVLENNQMFVRPCDSSSNTYCNGILEASRLYEPPLLTALFALHLVIF